MDNREAAGAGRQGAGGKKKIIIPAVLALAALLFFLSFRDGLTGPKSGDLVTSGTIEATEVMVSAEVGGKAIEAAVEEGQRVSAGQPILKIDPAAYELGVQQAEAALAIAKARLLEAEEGPRSPQVRQADEQYRKAQADLEGAQIASDRIRALYAEGAATKAQLDEANTRLRSARAQAQSAGAQADLVREGAGIRSIDSLRAAARQAEAAMGLAKLNLERATVRAPVAGVVLRRLVEPGSTVAPGAPVAQVADLDHLWVRIYVPVTDVPRLKLGGSVQVSVDGLKGRSFRGEITQISERAEFTPKNVQTKEERVKTVHAVKVRLREGFGELKPGIPADVNLSPALNP